MVEFKDFMRPEQRAHYERVNVEVARLFKLTTPFLARTLIRHIRAARVRHPGLLRQTSEIGHQAMSIFACDIIPELCHRMGETTSVEGERSHQVRAMSDSDFRIHAGFFIMSSSSIISDGTMHNGNFSEPGIFASTPHVEAGYAGL